MSFFGLANNTIRLNYTNASDKPVGKTLEYIGIYSQPVVQPVAVDNFYRKNGSILYLTF